MNTRQALEASLAETPVTIESIRIAAQKAVEKDHRLRRVSRLLRDAAVFADQSRELDCTLTLEKAARTLLQIPEPI